MEATRDFIPEDLEGAYPAQGVGLKDWRPGSAAELLLAERQAIKNAVDGGLRPASDLEAWDAAHQEAIPDRKKERKRRVGRLAEVVIPDDVEPIPDAEARAVPEPHQFIEDDEDEDGEGETDPDGDTGPDEVS